jgi:hypothetical protein
MTNKQMDRELSKDYLAWTTSPSLSIMEPIEEIQRLCEVIVELRAKLRKANSAAKKGRR